MDIIECLAEMQLCQTGQIAVCYNKKDEEYNIAVQYSTLMELISA